MTDLNFPALIPLPESSEPSPVPGTSRATSPRDHLADLLTDAVQYPIFSTTTLVPPRTPPSAPIPIHQSPRSPDFGPFIANRARDDPLDAQDLLSFSPPSEEAFGSLKEDFLDGAHERVQARRDRVVQELIDHEDDPLYWHPRQVVTSPAGAVANPMDQIEPLGPSSQILAHDALAARARRGRRRSTSASLAEKPVLEKDEASPSTSEDDRTRPSSYIGMSSSPSRYDTLRRTLSRGVGSLFAHPSPHSSPVPPSTSPITANAVAPSPKPIPASLATVFVPPGPGVSHSTPFAPHPHPTLPPSGAPGFLEPDYMWDTGNWRADPSLAGTHRPLEPVGLLGRKLTTSPVLSPDVAAHIRPHLPPLSRLPRSWSLIYSLDQHGISLHTFYNLIGASFDPPNPNNGGCLLAIKDDRGGIFGVWLGGRIKKGGGGYYGTGESFLWKLLPKEDDADVKVFKWTGKNEYVALCEDNYISFGGGDGRTGLYLDSAFDRGTSETCPCFDNEPLCYSADGVKGRFSCVGLEVWRVGGL